MVEHLNFPPDEVAEACADFYLNYGGWAAPVMGRLL